MADLGWVAAQLHGGTHREFWLTSLAVFVYFWLVERVSPSQDRYWKRVIRGGHRYGAWLRPLFALDRILARVPGVRLLAWNTVIFGRR